MLHLTLSIIYKLAKPLDGRPKISELHGVRFCRDDLFFHSNHALNCLKFIGQSKIFIRITIGGFGLKSKLILICLLLASIETASADSHASDRLIDYEEGYEQTICLAQSKPNKRFKWLFDEKPASKEKIKRSHSTIFTVFDTILKSARERYLSNDTKKAMEQYRSSIKELLRIIDLLPSGHPELKDALERARVFEEFAMKMLGPVDYDVSPTISKEIFHLMEEKRAVLRLITLKMADIKDVFDLPSHLIDLENKLLLTLLSYINDNKNQDTGHIRNKLQSVRTKLSTHSPRWSFFESSTITNLVSIQTEVLRDNELILDINLLPDRALLGHISKNQCSYYQFRIDPSDLSEAVLDLQKKIKGHTKGDESSFMGHAWKEASRRVYRALFSIPPQPDTKKTTIYVLPEKTLWYLPFSILLDPSDKALGHRRTISMLPSSRMLVFHRSILSQEKHNRRGAKILGFESTPWIPQEQLTKNLARVSPDRRIGMNGVSQITQLILSNRSYPKPSKFMLGIDKIAPKSALWVGPAATLDNWLKQKRDGGMFTLLAVPAPTPDRVTEKSQPTLIFSFDKNNKRRLMARDMFAKRHSTRMMAIPNAWIEFHNERTEPLGQGPLLLSLAIAYSGASSYMINFSNPQWGEDQPYLMELIKTIANGANPRTAIRTTRQKLPVDNVYSFTGKPPAWAGWILVGCPGPWDFGGNE